MRFYTIDDQTFTFQFEIDPYIRNSAQSDLEFGCDISAQNSSAIVIDTTLGQITPDPALSAYYCDTDPSENREPRNFGLVERATEADRVPTGTVFYCRLEGDTHAVTISKRPGGMTYAYGAIGSDAPELVLERTTDQLDVLPHNGAGPRRFGQITFRNGAYTYTAFYTHALAETRSTPSPPDLSIPTDATLQRGLVVEKDGDSANPVFSKACMPAFSYDGIMSLNQSSHSAPSSTR